MKTNFYKNRYFWIAWILISFAFNQFSILKKYPEGIHQQSQTDRACIALNYYQVSMNFFEPRVSETRQSDGIVGLEFPIIPYLSAIGFKIFGPHHFIFRLITFLIVTFGVYAVWLITGFFIRKWFWRLSVVLIWYCSPILVFYTANFVPDPAAMSFSMIGWYFFMKFIFRFNIGSSFLWMIFFFTLSGLLKITFLINYLAVISVLFLPFFRNNLKLAPVTRSIKNIALLIAPFLIVSAWYVYTTYLNSTYGNPHFLGSTYPAKNIQDFFQKTYAAFHSWGNSLYKSSSWIVFILLFVYAGLQTKIIGNLTGLIALILIGGSGAVFVLFNNQFQYHDYYFCIFYPALFFAILFVQQTLVEGKQIFLGTFQIASVVGFVALFFINFNQTRTMQNRRYTEKDYYYQNVIPDIAFLQDFKDSINAKIPKNEEIIVAYDQTPNGILYNLQRRGYRVYYDFNSGLINELTQKYPAKYLFINDIQHWNKNHDSAFQFKKELIVQKRNLYVYRILKSQKRY